MFTNERHQQSTYNKLKSFRNRGKQAIKEDALRQRVQGVKYENEYKLKLLANKLVGFGILIKSV